MLSPLMRTNKTVFFLGILEIFFLFFAIKFFFSYATFHFWFIAVWVGILWLLSCWSKEALEVFLDCLCWHGAPYHLRCKGNLLTTIISNQKPGSNTLVMKMLLRVLYKYIHSCHSVLVRRFTIESRSDNTWPNFLPWRWQSRGA